MLLYRSLTPDSCAFNDRKGKDGNGFDGCSGVAGSKRKRGAVGRFILSSVSLLFLLGGVGLLEDGDGMFCKAGVRGRLSVHIDDTTIGLHGSNGSQKFRQLVLVIRLRSCDSCLLNRVASSVIAKAPVSSRSGFSDSNLKKKDLSDFYFNIGKSVAFGTRDIEAREAESIEEQRKTEKLEELSKEEKMEEKKTDSQEKEVPPESANIGFCRRKSVETWEAEQAAS